MIRLEAYTAHEECLKRISAECGRAGTYMRQVIGDIETTRAMRKGISVLAKKTLLFFIVLTICGGCSWKTSTTTEICTYRFSNEEMVQKYKDTFNEIVPGLVLGDDSGDFEVRRHNCNYYVSYYSLPRTPGGHMMIIFDALGEVVAINPGV